MRNIDDREETGRKKKIMTFMVATNVIASRPPERRPTGTPHARANLVLPHSPKLKRYSETFCHKVLSVLTLYRVMQSLGFLFSLLKSGYS